MNRNETIANIVNLINDCDTKTLELVYMIMVKAALRNAEIDRKIEEVAKVNGELAEELADLFV